MSSDLPIQGEPEKNAKKRVCVAKIATAHGIKGLVKLHVFTENLELLNAPLFTSKHGDETLSLTLKNATAKHWLAEVKNISDRTEAEKLRGTELFIEHSKLPPPKEGEFYVTDLIGMKVLDKKGNNIGTVIAFENFGAGDLLEIQPANGDSFYLPFNDETVPEILDDKIIIEIPEGLLD